MKYLGCTLFERRKKIEYFNDLINKFEKKLAGWKSKLLSHGGRIVLIKHVLQSLPLYSMAAFEPPKAVLNIMASICSNFLWGQSEFGNRCHWVS